MRIRCSCWMALIAVLVTLGCSAQPTLDTSSSGSLRWDPVLLPAAQVGVPFEVKITILQNKTPVAQFLLHDGTLPSGLTLTKVQGEDIAVLSGVPDQEGTFAFTLEAGCFGTNKAGQSGTQDYTIIVQP
jgi:hypothetical protein